MQGVHVHCQQILDKDFFCYLLFDIEQIECGLAWSILLSTMIGFMAS